MSEPLPPAPPYNSILWNVHPVAREAEEGVVVDLEWGWTAGMSEEDMKTLAPDCPRGHDFVRTTLRHAKLLRDALNEIIEKHEARDEELQMEGEKRFREKFPNWDEMMGLMSKTAIRSERDSAE